MARQATPIRETSEVWHYAGPRGNKQYLHGVWAPNYKERKKMKNYRAVLNGLMQDESGQDLIEYALVAALIGLAAITGMKNVATGVSSAFNSISSSLTSAV